MRPFRPLTIAMHLGLAAYCGLSWPGSVSAQLVGDRKQVDCGNLTEGDVIDSSIEIICGFTAEQVIEMMRLAQSPSEADKLELFRRLDDLLPEASKLRVGAIRSFFQTLQEREVPLEQLQDRFVEIAIRHLELLDEINRFRVRDPEVQALRDEAETALNSDTPNLDLAKSKLADARELVRQKRQAATKLLADQQREEALLVREQAGIEESRLRFDEAAVLYEEAARLLPDDDEEQRWSDLIEAAGMWLDEGQDFGNNAALQRSIDVYGQALELRPRDRVPLDWATTQNNLGNALQTLGSRESGTERLELAVQAFKAALEEFMRDRVPLQWATTQNNLGNALQTLGSRESGTERLELAVQAFKAALEEWTRDRVPLDWAMTQNNLGNALQTLGARESGTESLERAVQSLQTPPSRKGHATAYPLRLGHDTE